jgi:hypothetical protein
MWKVDIAKKEDEDNENEKKRKDGIIGKISEEARRADEDPRYGTTDTFNWADEVETTTLNPIASVTVATRAPRDFSALRSGVRNPWSSLNHRHRRSHPHQPRPRTSQPHYVYPSNSPTLNLHVPTPALVQVIETVRHPHGIAPSRPIIRTTSPVHHTSSLVTHPTPLAHPIFVVQCQCGSTIPVRPTQYPFPASPHFDRRHHFGFQRPSQWRFRDCERGRSHLRGGQM